MLNQRQNIILTATLLLVFFVLYVLSRTILSDAYLFEWTSRNWYFGIWIMALILIFTKTQIMAVALTLGNLFGVIFGQVLGDIMRSANIQKVTSEMTEAQKASLYAHHGVELWLGTVFVFLLVGIILQMLFRKKCQNKT